MSNFTLITGASSGIGYEFAKIFAEHGHNFILSARSKDVLNELAEELHKKHSVDVYVMPLDLTKPENSNDFQTFCEHRNIFLENIVNSKKPECNGFKGVAAADLKRSPSVKNTCDWVNPGDGLARSLMYTIGYYLTMRDQYVIPTLEKRSVKLIENKSLVSDFTAIAYGAEGLDHAKWLMQKYRVGRGTNAKTLQNNIRKDSVYLSNIKDKMQEISCIRQGKAADKACKQQPISEADAEADSCITK